MLMSFISLAIVVFLVVWFVSAYNSLQRMRVYITEAWAGIDVQLKRKANIIPNLVDVLKMQMKFESDLLTKLTAARTGLVEGSNKSRMEADDALTKAMPGIYAVAESYPELGTNPSFRQLMSEFKDCEDKVAYSRTRYNVSVANYNMAIVTIPTNIVAAMFHFEKAELFEIAAQARSESDNMRISQL